jgi:FMN phosphatase YigB (HAD superfamily)
MTAPSSQNTVKKSHNEKPYRVVFLFDVDNTLLNNDRVTEDLRQFLMREFGEERQKRFWAIYEQLRSEIGYADYLGALQRYRAENPRDPRFLQMSKFMMKYPFSNRLYPRAIDVIEHFQPWGPCVILSDGDVVFQPRKIDRSGLGHAVNENVLIYLHKEHELDDVECRYPAEHYVIVDDKLRILDAVKKIWRGGVTTVFVRQGHYALDPKTIAKYPPADVTVDCIGDLLNYDFQALRAAAMGKTVEAVTTANAPKADLSGTLEPENQLLYASA